MTSSKRDPRIDPRIGDEVTCDKAYRKVVGVTLDNNPEFPFRARYVTYTSDKRKGEHKCWISAWQDWCQKNKANVVNVGRDHTP